MSAAPSVDGAGMLLVVDVQNSFAHPAHTPWLSAPDRARVEAAVERSAELVAAFRSAGAPVVWVRLVQSEDRPWTAARRLRGVADDEPWPGDEPCVLGTDGVDWYRISPAPGETVIDKRYYSAFRETALADVLAAHAPEWIAVAGLTTECCILATVYDAVQSGHRTVIVGDATAAYDDADHVAATRMMIANAATATTVDALTAAVGVR